MARIVESHRKQSKLVENGRKTSRYKFYIVKKSKLEIILIVATCVLVVASMVFWFLSDGKTWTTVAISVSTTAYHFAMRLLVGLVFDLSMKNRADFNKPFFVVRPWEIRLYDFLRVGKWKKLLPTFRPDYFSLSKHSLDELIGAMCQAEVVHSVCALLSWLPLLLIIPFGEPIVFALTSMFGFLLDLVFVVTQRYNRARVVKILNRRKAN